MTSYEWFTAGFVSAVVSMVLTAMLTARYALRHPQLIMRMFFNRKREPSGNSE